MDGKRIIFGIDIGKRWLDVAREDAAEVEQHANEAATIAGPGGNVSIQRATSRCSSAVAADERELEAALATANAPLGGGAFALGQGIPPGSGHQG